MFLESVVIIKMQIGKKMLTIIKKNSISIILIFLIFQNLCICQVLNDKNIIFKSNAHDKLILEFEIFNNNEYDMIIPGYDWFITGWINNFSYVAYNGHFKSMNGITYTNQLLLNENKIYVGLDGITNFKTTLIPKFIIVKPHQAKKIKILINKADLPNIFFSEKEYKFEIELAIGNNEILSDFESIFNFKLDKYIVDKEEYLIKLKKYPKGKYFFTCEEFKSSTKLNECFSNIFYIAFKNHIKIIVNIKILE